MCVSQPTRVAGFGPRCLRSSGWETTSTKGKDRILCPSVRRAGTQRRLSEKLRSARVRGAPDPQTKTLRSLWCERSIWFLKPVYFYSSDKSVNGWINAAPSCRIRSCLMYVISLTLYVFVFTNVRLPRFSVYSFIIRCLIDLAFESKECEGGSFFFFCCLQDFVLKLRQEELSVVKHFDTNVL